MENENFLQKLASQFGQNASVKNVFGDPIQTGNKTIIPVAQIAYGLGGGYGHGIKKNKVPPTYREANEEDGTSGEGGGGGGGMYAKPKGVYEVTATATRFVPASNIKQVLLTLAIGFIIRGWLMKRK